MVQIYLTGINYCALSMYAPDGALYFYIHHLVFRMILHGAGDMISFFFFSAIRMIK